MRVTFFPLAVLLGGVVAAPAPADEPTKKELETAVNRIKQIGLGFHAYCDDHEDKLADDITDKDGRPLLSWRVALLPYVDQKELYKQFKLDEAWDSDHNKKLVAKIPDVFAPVRGKAKPGETFLQRFVGKGALFNEKGSDYKIGTIPDGTTSTALVVEAGIPVVWSQPADLPFIAKAPLPQLGGPFDGDFHVLLGDGSVQRFKKDYDADEMKKVIMPDDAQAIDLSKLQK